MCNLNFIEPVNLGYNMKLERPWTKRVFKRGSRRAEVRMNSPMAKEGERGHPSPESWALDLKPLRIGRTEK